jgi:hypothetical protein
MLSRLLQRQGPAVNRDTVVVDDQNVSAHHHVYSHRRLAPLPGAVYARGHDRGRF